jgi:hypothetical protein
LGVSRVKARPETPRPDHRPNAGRCQKRDKPGKTGIFLETAVDYNKQVFEMLQHLCADFSAAQMEKLVVALANGLSKTLSLIDDHDDMHKYLEGMLLGLAAQACIDHSEFHEKIMKKPPQQKSCDKEQNDGTTVDYETFLRDIFQPTKTND